MDDDRRVYLDLLSRQASRFGLVLHGYCLMTNHVHLIATPTQANSLSKTLGRAHFLYTLYINRFHGRVGHLWQNRFFSCALDDEHLWTAFSYVDRNPVRAGLIRHAWDYPWSSAAAHCLQTKESDNSGVLDMQLWKSMIGRRDWKQALEQPQDKALVAAIRGNTLTGRPLGTDSFIGKLEVAIGKRLRPLPIGRPRKTPT